MSIWSGIITIGKWIIAVIKYPLSFNKHLKMIEELNSKIDSPSRYRDELELIRGMSDMKIQFLTEEKNKLASSDTVKKTQIEDLINKLKQAQEENDKLFKVSERTIALNEELIKQRDAFRKGFEILLEKDNKLSEELEKSKFIPANILGSALSGNKYSSSLAEALFQRQLNQGANRK